MELFGLELEGELPQSAVPLSAVVLVEYLDGDDSRPCMRLMASTMPLWTRIGMLRLVLACDEADAINVGEIEK